MEGCQKNKDPGEHPNSNGLSGFHLIFKCRC